MEMVWWHWALIGFGCLLAELAFPAFVMVWFGIGGLIVMLALLALADMPLDAQIFLWIASSVAMTFAWFRFFKDKAPLALTGRASAAVLGEVGLMIEAAAPFKEGRVRFQKPIVGSDTWTCLADQELAIGTRVRVTRIEGNKVVVESVAEKQGESL